MIDADRDRPDVNDSDDDIRRWARVHHFDRLPIVHIELVGQVSQEQPDTATIDWHEEGCPVTRWQRLRL